MASYQSSPGLDCIQAMRYYIDRIVSSIEGMKVLLLDAETVQIVSMVYSQSAILEREVYLVEKLSTDQQHEPMMHLRAVCFMRPTEANAQLLAKELAQPKYAEYHLFFSNIVPSSLLRTIAEADEYESVRQVQEYYGDFMAINPELFTINLDWPLALSAGGRPEENSVALQRSVQGILSALLAFKKKPSQIRYQGTSAAARQVAAAAAAAISQDQIFEFRRTEGPTLLVLDRRDDPVTPLLTQWTYQAMVHELLSLNSNRVSLKGAPGIKPDLDEVVLSCTTDDFFAKQRNANFGDLGVAVKGLLDEYQRQAKLNESIQSIDDMQAFLDRFPAFRSHSLNVSKHVAVMTELARIVDQEALMDVSQFEQELACDDDYSAHYKGLCEKLGDARIKPGSKLRLAIIFALRYEDKQEQAANMATVKAGLSRFGVSPDQIGLIDSVVAYAGHSKRAPGLFGTMADRLKKKMQTTLQGISNVYTRHEPAFMPVIDAALKGRLKESQFPAVGAVSAKPSDVIVFIVGGATYEEATKIIEYTAALPPGSPKVVLGSSAVLNSSAFLDAVRKGFPPVAYRG